MKLGMVIVLAFLSAGTMAVCGDSESTSTPPPSAPTPSISAQEYKQTTIALFNELLAMVEDGVVSPTGPDLGFAAGNPRAMRWRENVEALQLKGTGLPINDACWPISETVDGISNVCGNELWNFVTDIVGDDWDEYQKLVARFSQLTEGS